MKAIITGMNGTVAPYVYQELIRQNVKVVVWDRRTTDIDTEEAVYEYIKEVNPDLFFHIATGPITWVEYIAKATNKLGIKLIFTSSVSVYSEEGSGPYTTESIPDAEDEYGKHKIECEKAVRLHNPQAYILRLGWQIGSAAGTNNMMDFLVKKEKEFGFIEASSKWYPSCSFLEDTGESAVQIALRYEPDTYLVNSNKKFSFFEIVQYLMKKHDTTWDVREITSFERDDRMFDDRVKIKELF